MHETGLSIAGYTGITQVDRVGLSVEACAQRVGRFGFVSQRLMRLQAAKMSSVANWELKATLGRQLWECAAHWGEWRNRIKEMRGHEHLIEGHANDKLADVFEEALYSQSDDELIVALYHVLLPAFKSALERYLEQTNPLVDAPTVRLIRHVLLDLEDQVAFGSQITGYTADAQWQAHLQTYLDAAGGIDGSQPERHSYELPPPRSNGDWRMPLTFSRDARFSTTIPKANPFDEGNTLDALHSKMWVRAQEMTAAELCASVLYEWDDLPYEGCLDLARHCWDEVRHSLFGQVALESEHIPLTSTPNWVGYAGHTMPYPPQKRYSHLAIATEASAMAYPGGKRGEWEWCREKAQHPLMTTFQDFDWADEVNHVGFGRKWLIQHYFHGDRLKAQAMADETTRERARYYAQQDAAT